MLHIIDVYRYLIAIEQVKDQMRPSEGKFYDIDDFLASNKINQKNIARIIVTLKEEIFKTFPNSQIYVGISCNNNFETRIADHFNDVDNDSAKFDKETSAVGIKLWDADLAAELETALSDPSEFPENKGPFTRHRPSASRIVPGGNGGNDNNDDSPSDIIYIGVLDPIRN